MSTPENTDLNQLLEELEELKRENTSTKQMLVQLNNAISTLIQSLNGRFDRIEGDVEGLRKAMEGFKAYVEGGLEPKIEWVKSKKTSSEWIESSKLSREFLDKIPLGEKVKIGEYYYKRYRGKEHDRVVRWRE